MDDALENGRVTIERRARPRYSLDELLAQCEATDDYPAEDRDWLDVRPVGKELL